MIRLFAIFRGLIYASGFVLLWWWVVAAARPLDARLPFAIPDSFEIPGMILIILGGAIELSCVATFALVGKGTPAPFDAPREFVAVGLYKYVRNPMYVGALIVIIGASWMLHSLSALFVGLIFVAMAHIFVLVYEEPTLERKFGESYLSYKQSVNRWLPRIPKAEVCIMDNYVDSTEQLVTEIFVRDIRRSASFYRSLGFQLLRDAGDFVELTWENHRLFLAEISAVHDRKGIELPDAASFPVANVRVMVPDVDSYWKLAGETGARIVMPIADRYYGLRDFTIADPDGFGIRFASRL